VIAAVFATLVTPGYAAAAPDPQTQIDTLWRQLEPLIEQYNGVHEKLLADQAKAAELEKQLAPVLAKVNLAQARVGAIASQLYMEGPLADLNAMLGGVDGPSGLADRLASIDAVASGQQETIDGAADMMKVYNEQKKPLDDLIAQEKAADADLAAKKTQIQAQIDKLQKIAGAQLAADMTVLKPGGKCPVTDAPNPITKGYRAAQFACSKIGKPYGWGDAGPNSYDCSGLTMAAWGSVGVSLPHKAASQVKYGTRATSPQVGDLIFYYSATNPSHVAIYVGGGWVVHAPRAGDHVRMATATGISSIKAIRHLG